MSVPNIREVVPRLSYFSITEIKIKDTVEGISLLSAPSSCPEWFMPKLYKPNNSGSLDVGTGFALGFFTSERIEQLKQVSHPLLKGSTHWYLIIHLEYSGD